MVKLVEEREAKAAENSNGPLPFVRNADNPPETGV
jgi:hypothetical protein